MGKLYGSHDLDGAVTLGWLFCC